MRWFRAQYPHLATLLFHPKNEGHGNRIAGAIAKAEGVVPGVPDLILTLPNERHNILCLELKAPKGRQSPSQKMFEALSTIAGAEYHIIRSFDEFRSTVQSYLSTADSRLVATIRSVAASIQADAERQRLKKERQRLKKLWKQ